MPLEVFGMPLSKPELERVVFDKFVKHIGVKVTSFKSCNPPEPDILCDTECGALYIELTDNTSQSIQKSVHARDEATQKEAFWIDPFPEGYKHKFDKQYQTNSIACELVIYFGIHPVVGLGDHFDSRLQENIEWIKGRKHSSAFRKVWIYDYHQDCVLACVNGAA